MHRKLKWRLETTGTKTVYEDNHLLVLNKPARVLALPDRSRHEPNNLYTILCEELGKVYVVHGVDKDTSGLVVYAKTVQAHTSMIKQCEQRMVEKVYFGIVVGVPPPDVGRIVAPLLQSSKYAATVKVSNRAGQEAVTEYRVLERFNRYAFLELRPRTERMHQLRVHLQSIGAPLLADLAYGDGKPFFLSHIKPGYKAFGVELPLLDRAALHAFAISFDDPEKGERINLSAEMPKDMTSTLNYLRKFGQVSAEG